jgi:hypothetical protein
MADRMKVLRNAYKKLDGLPLGFGIPAYSKDVADTVVESMFGMDLDDTIREVRMRIEDVEPDSYDELHIELRVVYYALCRFRLSGSIFFKFSTAVDGKTVDKSMIPKMISQVISEYDTKFKKWRSGSTAGVWNRSVTDNAQ